MYLGVLGGMWVFSVVLCVVNLGEKIGFSLKTETLLSSKKKG